MRQLGRKLVMASLVAAASCGPARPIIGHEEFLRMPREARVAIYDGENDVVIARSRRDDASNRADTIEREMNDIDVHWKATETRLKKENLADKISLAKPSVSARRAYLWAELKVAKLGVRTAEAEIELAQARLNQTLQRQLARTGRVGPTTVNQFDDEVLSLEKRAREQERKELDVRVEAQKVFETWKQTEDGYIRATNDYNSGVWID